MDKRLVKLAEKNREKHPESFEKLYSSLVEKKILKRYTVKDELSILRQRDSKPLEFEEYYSFVEKCKTEAKEELGILSS